MAHLDHLLRSAPIDESGRCHIVVDDFPRSPFSGHRSYNGVGLSAIVAVHQHLAYLHVGRQRVVVHLHHVVRAAALIVKHGEAFVIIHTAQARLLHKDLGRVEDRHRMATLVFRGFPHIILFLCLQACGHNQRTQQNDLLFHYSLYFFLVGKTVQKPDFKRQDNRNNGAVEALGPHTEAHEEGQQNASDEQRHHAVLVPQTYQQPHIQRVGPQQVEVGLGAPMVAEESHIDKQQRHGANGSVYNAIEPIELPLGAARHQSYNQHDGEQYPEAHRGRHAAGQGLPRLVKHLRRRFCKSLSVSE